MGSTTRCGPHPNFLAHPSMHTISTKTVSAPYSPTQPTSQSASLCIISNHIDPNSKTRPVNNAVMKAPTHIFLTTCI